MPEELHEQFLRPPSALYGLFEFGKAVLRYVHGVVPAVLPPLEVVVDGNRSVRKFLAVFADFPLNRERDVLEFPKDFGPSALFSFHIL